MKENNTWQTVYEQLQEFLNECWKVWLKIYRVTPKKKNISMYERYIYINAWLYISYHELFSKDSWLMEFVEWREIYPTVANIQAHYINMCEKTAEQKVQYFLSNAKLPTKSE